MMTDFEFALRYAFLNWQKIGCDFGVGDSATVECIISPDTGFVEVLTEAKT